MLEQIMSQINNYFYKTVESVSGSFSGNVITGDFVETYLVGQYIRVYKSYLNDGVYKITAVTSTTITVEDSLQTENTNDDFLIWGLSPPKSFLELATEITNYSTNANVGISSESQGNRSVSYAEGSSWEKVFKSRLNRFRKLYGDEYTLLRRYNIRSKDWL